MGSRPGTPAPAAAPRPALWAGIECSVARIGDAYFDQIEKTGHDARPGDAALLASLGVGRVRYPLVWERLAPETPERLETGDLDARLAAFRERGVGIVAGLVHHGGGPRYTSLVDPAFPEKLARYARVVAERYPEVRDWTPVNEPVTTARFAGLYGLWHPHRRSDVEFLRCLCNECKGIALAMAAVREVNPDARLVHTEDLGLCTGVGTLAYQVAFENERRFLGQDLLCGRIDRAHPLWSYLLERGLTEAELAWFRESPCPPQVFGINHYVTSDRYLDTRIEKYPACTHGGNGRHVYADVDAVRVLPEEEDRFARVVGDMWKRYGATLALTEVHIGCTRDEQMRWLKEAWDSCVRLASQGIPVEAVTVWSALGAFDWDSLMTLPRGSYETGAFDVRGGTPRATALAGLVEDLSAEAESRDAPVFAEKGWWRRPERLVYEAPTHDPAAVARMLTPVRGSYGNGRPLLITGASGTLGRAFARACYLRGLSYRLLSRSDLDIAAAEDAVRVMRELRPWAVINAAGYVRVDEAEGDVDRCLRENAFGPSVLAASCEEVGARFVTFSSDLVFDGERGDPYLEDHAPRPLNVYGRSKADAERGVAEAMPTSLVVRTSAFFSPWDEYNFVTCALRAMRRREPFRVASGHVVSPTYVPDLVNVTLDMLLDRVVGLVHVANDAALGWGELARLAARMAGADLGSLQEVEPEEMGWRAPRPRYSVLGNARGVSLPTIDDALFRFLRECQVEGVARA